MNGSRIMQAAIVDEFEEDMVTIERIRVLQEGLGGECRWCWGNNGGEETTKCLTSLNPQARCRASCQGRGEKEFPIKNFNDSHGKISHLSYKMVAGLLAIG
jgi:hypothetical protein